MSWVDTTLDTLIDFYDSQRIPLSSTERSSIQGKYRYFGAQGVIDHLNDFIFDGEYILVAEDGENLRSRNQPIAFYVKGKFWVNNHAHIIKAKKGISTDKFIRYLLNIIPIDAYVTGAAQPKLSQANMRAIKVTVPKDFYNHQKISTMLSAYDDLIENNLKRITLLQEMAQITYEEWFVRIKFPDHESAVFDDETALPEGWVNTKLGNILTLNYGKALKAESRNGGEIPVYGSAGLVGYHDESLVVEKGVILGRKGNVGSVYWSHNPFYPIDTVYYVTSNYSLYYIYYLLKNQKFINNDAAVPGLNRNAAYAKKVIFPNKELIKLFEAKVKIIFSTIENLQKQINLLKEARDILLPRLMTGMVDIEQVELPEAMLRRLENDETEQKNSMAEAL